MAGVVSKDLIVMYWITLAIYCHGRLCLTSPSTQPLLAVTSPSVWAWGPPWVGPPTGDSTTGVCHWRKVSSLPVSFSYRCSLAYFVYYIWIFLTMNTVKSCFLFIIADGLNEFFSVSAVVKFYFNIYEYGCPMFYFISYVVKKKRFSQRRGKKIW